MPLPLNKSSWDLHNKVLRNAATNFMEKEVPDSASLLRSLLRSDDNSIEESSVMDITVSFDGTWHHRGFKSSHRVDVAMSVDTGDFLDLVVLSKSCMILYVTEKN